MKDEVEQLEEQNSVPPQPLPRVRRVRNEEEAKKTEKARKKKRKAAEVIASVLRRESKKLPRVATVLQEAEDREKGRYCSGWNRILILCQYSATCLLQNLKWYIYFSIFAKFIVLTAH